MPSWAVQLILGVLPYLYKFFTEKHTPTFRRGVKKIEWFSIEKAAQLESKRQERLRNAGK